MKFAIVLVFTILGVFRLSEGAAIELPGQLVELLRESSKICREETGVDPSLVEEMRKVKLPDDPKAKCYLKCMMMHLNAMQDDGSLDIELIEATMPDAMKAHGGVETVRTCKDVHKPDLCETAYEILACFKNENPALAAMFE